MLSFQPEVALSKKEKQEKKEKKKNAEKILSIHRFQWLKLIFKNIEENIFLLYSHVYIFEGHIFLSQLSKYTIKTNVFFFLCSLMLKE